MTGVKQLPLLIRKNAVKLFMGIIYKWGTSEVKKIESKWHYTLEVFTENLCIFNTKVFQLDYSWKFSKLTTYSILEAFRNNG